jgi:hypothetical protein
MILKNGFAISIIMLFIGTSIIPIISGNIEIFSVTAAMEGLDSPTVVINVEPYEAVYEGDIVDCDISGNPTIIYWRLNGQSNHTTFYEDNPVIFDPELTPLDETFVNLTVYAENEYGYDSDTVPIKLYRIFFGDIHWHTVFSDGDYNLDAMYKNAVEDNYLDFGACTDHGELLDGITRKFGGLRKYDGILTIIEKILGFSEWQTMKEKAVEYYDPGNFTTFLGFEWTAAEWSIGGKWWTPHGRDDVGHINFYYRDIYPSAPEYSDLQKLNYDSIFKTMTNEWDKGHLNIGFSHHSLGKAGRYNFTTNWTYMADDMKNICSRNKILRGVETFSRWGTSIGGNYTPDVPLLWPYNIKKSNNHSDYWVENALWEWSDDKMKNQRFAFIASSDTHEYDRPGSALYNESYLPVPSGIAAVYSVHNTRGEIWDAMNNCDSYALQLLKIRANVRFNGQLSYGGWINSSSPLKIRITAHSTFPGFDSSGKSMWPHGYSPDELDYPITDIWLVKKDRERGQPWCKVINHTTPDENMGVVFFEDSNVRPNDFYWVAVKQKGQLLESNQDDEFMAFIGPFFINNVY